MTQERIPRESLVFRRWMRLCMQSKNLVGASPDTVRREFGDCAERFKRARQQVAISIDLEAEATRAAEEFLRANRES